MESNHKMGDQLEILWETHDFSVKALASLEDQYDNLLVDVRDFVSDDFHSAIERIANNPSYQEKYGFSDENIQKPNNEGLNKDVLIAKVTKLTSDMESYYNKQISTITELKKYYEDNVFNIPEGREISDSSLDDLQEITLHLREVLLESTESVRIMLTGKGF